MTYNITLPVNDLEGNQLRHGDVRNFSDFLHKTAEFISKNYPDIEADTFLTKLSESLSGRSMTFSSIFRQALVSPSQQGHEANHNEDIEKYDLALRMQDKEEIDLTAEEIVLIKKSVYSTFISPIIKGRVRDFLEQKNKG